ncbi:MAG: methionine--tRNA ligase [Phycisphaerales bacterium]|nr:methionine--tRNA ligase [Phycisphaerales bacterium]
MTHTHTYYITTPIYYVNDKPHIGHCYTTTVADAIARFQRLAGRDVYFLTGTDEHGQKVEKSAAAAGVTPQQLADENAAVFQQAMTLIGASNDDFIRTTQPRHEKQVQAAVARLIASGDIYLGTFEGWYDEGQEEYVTENAAREKNYTAFNGKPLVRAKEDNYYFRLSKWQPELEKFLAANPHFVKPAARMNEVLGRLREGLQDVPISRTNFSWGIPILDGPGGTPGKHVIYVWIDALLNYTTAIGVIDGLAGTAPSGSQGRNARYWPADVHLIGKEILWFHAVIWPALLMALGLETPRCVYAHSFWISEGQKMSKTLGNFIDLATLRAYIDRFGLDALRWYLLTQGPLRETDADFSYAKFVEVYNADLANGIGNCASRVGNMIEKYFDGKVPPAPADPVFHFGPSSPPQTAIQTQPQDVASALESVFDWPRDTHEFVHKSEKQLRSIDLTGALLEGIALVGRVDAFINLTAPFKLAKTIDANPAARDQLAAILYSCAEAVRIASLLLSPAMPTKMAQLWKTWNCQPTPGVPLHELARFGGKHALQPGSPIAKGEPLFMRADAKEPAPKPA